MSGRTWNRRPDGRWVQGFRKTDRRNPRRPAPDAPWRMVLMIPPAWALRAPGAGATGFAGISIAPHATGPLAIGTGPDPERLCRRMGVFLLSVAHGAECVLGAGLTHEHESQEQEVVVMPGRVEFPRRGGKPWVVEA